MNVTWKMLKNMETVVTPFKDIDKEAGVRYSQELLRLVKSKGRVLTHGELQLVVDQVNENLDKDMVRLEAVEKVNVALVDGGVGLMEALKHPGLDLSGFKIMKTDEIRFVEELQMRLANKSVMDGDGVGLWYEDIVAGVEEVLSDIREVETFVGVLRGVNSAVDAGDMIGVFNYLLHF